LASHDTACAGRLVVNGYLVEEVKDGGLRKVWCCHKNGTFIFVRKELRYKLDILYIRYISYNVWNNGMKKSVGRES
jgi:hypothetical protein